MEPSPAYTAALLHMIYLLAHADGAKDAQEQQMVLNILKEEAIAETEFHTLESQLSVIPPNQVYDKAIALLEQCNEEERLCVFVHLYRLAKADNDLNMAEIRLMIKALNVACIEFTDVVLSARLAS
jgi:uncharacterized tellurite resistance protein B-like protein